MGMQRNGNWVMGISRNIGNENGRHGKKLRGSWESENSCPVISTWQLFCIFTGGDRKGFGWIWVLSPKVDGCTQHLCAVRRQIWFIYSCEHSLHFVSAVVTVDSSHMTVSSSALWSSFSLPSNFVSGHLSTMWFMVHRWPQSQQGDWARFHLCTFARHGPWPVWKRLSRDHVWRGRSKPGCRIVGSVTIEWLTTEADDQSSLHCIVVDRCHVWPYWALGCKSWRWMLERHQHAQANVGGPQWFEACCQLPLYNVEKKVQHWWVLVATRPVLIVWNKLLSTLVWFSFSVQILMVLLIFFTYTCSNVSDAYVTATSQLRSLCWMKSMLPLITPTLARSALCVVLLLLTL